jgi:hypothetical protein
MKNLYFFLLIIIIYNPFHFSQQNVKMYSDPDSLFSIIYPDSINIEDQDALWMKISKKGKQIFKMQKFYLKKFFNQPGQYQKFQSENILAKQCIEQLLNRNYIIRGEAEIFYNLDTLKEWKSRHDLKVFKANYSESSHSNDGSVQTFYEFAYFVEVPVSDNSVLLMFTFIRNDAVVLVEQITNSVNLLTK